MPRTYTPQLTDENIHRLYQLKQASGRSMVRLLNEIIDAYFATHATAITPVTEQS